LKHLLCLVCIAASLSGQSLSVSVNPTTVGPGGTATVTIAFSDAATSVNAAGFEWTLSLPAGVTAGPGSTTVGNKILSCKGALCVLAGTAPSSLNVGVIASGALASFPLTIGAAPAGNQTVTLTQVVATSATGTPITLSATPATLTIGPLKYDLNGDGKVDSADVQVALGQGLGNQSCTTGDVNGDGKCDVTDVILTVMAAMGLLH
jgi:hypothetical protein